jgi:hypothetical protein
MVYPCIFIIGVPALLVFFTIKKIIRARAVEKHGVKTNAVVTHIMFFRSSRGSADSVTLQYTDDAGAAHTAKITTAAGKHSIGDSIPLKYLSAEPSSYNIEGMRQGLWAILIFCTLLLAFAIFASFKLNEMAEDSN